MSKVKYELFENKALISAYCFDGGELNLVFPKGTDGFLRIGARIYKLNAETAKIDIAELEDGDVSPRLFTSVGEYALWGFEKRGRSLKLKAPTDEDLRTGIISLKRLEKCINSLEKEVSILHNKIETTTIF